MVKIYNRKIYRRKFNSLLDNIFKEFFILMIKYKDNINDTEWELFKNIEWNLYRNININMNDIINTIRLDKTKWTKEKFYEYISILEDIIFNTFFNTFKNYDYFIDGLINVIFKYKNILIK